MKKEKIIYFILTTAVFNAVLRTSPDSALTLFRLLIPVCLFLVYNISKRTFNYLFNVCLLFIGVSLFQTFITKNFIYPQVETITYSHLLSYCIHYISMFVVASLIYCLWVLNGNTFFEHFINYSSKLIKFILLIYVPYVLIGGAPEEFLVFGNINDLGCILTGGILVLLFDTNTKKAFKYAYIVLILFLLIYNDSKLAFFGGIVELGLYYIRIMSAQFPQMKKIISFFLLFIAFGGIFIFFNSSIEINGYSVHDMLYVPYNQITSGIYFDQSSQSFTFRTNNIIGITEILRKSLGIGIGPGNTSLVLKYLIPDSMESIRQDYVSSHIWWYEIMADIGWIIIIPMVLLYIRQWRKYSSMKSTKEQLFSEIFLIAFPLWCMSSSGLYTEFFSISMIALSIILYWQNYKKVTKKIRKLQLAN